MRNCLQLNLSHLKLWMDSTTVPLFSGDVMISKRSQLLPLNSAFKWILASTIAVAYVLSTQDASHALILDPARTALNADLTAAGFTGITAVGLFFGLLEFIMIAIPIGSGAMALSQMQRGTEAWLPWVTVMGGSLVFIAFVVVLVGQIYG